MNNKKRHDFFRTTRIGYFIFFIIFCSLLITGTGFASGLSSRGIFLIPYPQKVYFEGESFHFNTRITLVLDKDLSDADQFTADELIRDLKKEWNIIAEITDNKTAPAIILTRHNAPEMIGRQGYQLITDKNELIVRANGEEGLFYGTQTLLQLIRHSFEGLVVPGLRITDWPDIKKRAIHYDTKHHQDKKSYVKSFIKDLSRYKINMLVWEWEDKFAYPSHPEIGAPGAFTMEEMQEFTRYARQYHVQIVPLVQGLGHASYILKWPQHAPLREIAASNWEFCPLKEGTYDLLFDLWEDAIKATPGSQYIHIGSDETYELGSCEQCRKKAEETGRNGIYQLFVNKAARHLQKLGRKVMVWETPMQWERGNPVKKKIPPQKGLVLTESYSYNTPDFRYARQARSGGFEVFAYDPNPGTTALFLPYFYKVSEKGEIKHGALQNSYDQLSAAALSGAFDGMICTSWDDAGLHNQMWMLHFVNAAAYAWNGEQPERQAMPQSFFKNYYGSRVTDMEELFRLLNEGAYYFMSTFERNVWHYGEIGKTHLPDLPRGQIVEYDPFWNTEYRTMLQRSKHEATRMKRALQIIENNREVADKHTYDFEIFHTIARLIMHTCNTYEDLSQLEHTITEAHRKTFLDHQASLVSLIKAQHLLEKSLERRQEVFRDLIAVWQQTRLPKGLSTDDKNYFWQQDRARHFANRRPDMTYLIYDEQLLDMEGYLEKLKKYIAFYKNYYGVTLPADPEGTTKN
jgi:hypothetical protein